MGKSGDDTDGMEVGPNLVPTHAHGRLARNHPIVRNSPAPPPHRDARLFHRLPSQSGQLLGKRGLTSCSSDDRLYTDNERVVRVIDGNLGGFGGHIRPAFNTESVIAVNTRSVFDETHNARMARNGETGEFWKRLTQARTTCNPPKSMVQADIAKDYGVAGQSTVTKWKTDKGMPHYKVVKKIALDTNVNINWLLAGQGEMRPLPTLDPVTQRVVEVMAGLPSDQARIRVLESALLQRESTPAVAQILREAEVAAKEAEHAAPTRGRKIKPR